MILKMEKKRQTDEAYIKDLLKSTGYLFPETDEQMSIYEANVTLRELPEKFRTPEFVFNAVQNQRSSKHCTDMDKAILAGHIINTCNMKDFGRVKFQKLLYLVEHVCLLNLRSNYIRQTAGPYDGILLKRVETMLQQYHFMISLNSIPTTKLCNISPCRLRRSLTICFARIFRPNAT